MAGILVLSEEVGECNDACGREGRAARRALQTTKAPEPSWSELKEARAKSFAI